MADGLNKVFLLGNVGNDPELKQAGSSSLLKLRLVTNETRYLGDEKKETSTWHTVILWGKKADALAPHIKKGNKLFVEGKIVNRSYEDRNSGDKRWIFEIEAYKVIFAGGSREDRNGNGRQQQGVERRYVSRHRDDGF